MRGVGPAVAHFEKALSRDPSSLDAKAGLAEALAGRLLENCSKSVTGYIDQAEQLIEQVLATSPRHPLAHYARGQLFRAQRRFEAAIPEYELVIAANRNWVAAIASLGHCKFWTGRIEEAIPAQELAIRLSPRDPRLPVWFWRIGMVHLLQSRMDEAIIWLERARSSNPRMPGPHAWLASAYALIGDRIVPSKNLLRRAGSAPIGDIIVSRFYSLAGLGIRNSGSDRGDLFRRPSQGRRARRRVITLSRSWLITRHQARPDLWVIDGEAEIVEPFR